MSTHESSVFVAPAKINLFLHVVGRRADGYHLIQSAMRLIDLADELTVVATDDGRIARDGPVDGVVEADDLAIRAARLLQAASGTTRGATIGIVKRVPIGGGLGGGSSDAATALLALDRLWRLDWPARRLMELGASLGADVPFFVGGGDAFVEGIGERLAPIDLPPAHYALIHPGIAVPTAAIFGAAELTRDSEVIKISDFSRSVAKRFAIGREVRRIDGTTDGTTEDEFGREPDAELDGDPFDADLRNDLEPVATARFGAVREALSWLSRRDDGQDRTGARGPARMTGSGACVFREFDSREHAAAAIAALPASWTGWAVRSLARHPHAKGRVD